MSVMCVMCVCLLQVRAQSVPNVRRALRQDWQHLISIHQHLARVQSITVSPTTIRKHRMPIIVMVLNLIKSH